MIILFEIYPELKVIREATSLKILRKSESVNLGANEVNGSTAK